MSVAKKYLFLEHQKLVPASTPGTSPGNGIAIDARGYNSAIFNLSVANMTSATANVKVQHSDSSNSGFTDFQVASVTQQSENLTTSNTNTSILVDISGAKRYIRSVVTTSGTVSDANVYCLLGDSEYSENWEDSTQYGN